MGGTPTNARLLRAYEANGLGTMRQAIDQVKREIGCEADGCPFMEAMEHVPAELAARMRASMRFELDHTTTIKPGGLSVGDFSGRKGGMAGSMIGVARTNGQPVRISLKVALMAPQVVLCSGCHDNKTWKN